MPQPTQSILAALVAALLAGGVRAEGRSVAIVVARGTGVELSLTKGLAFKLGVEAQRRGLLTVTPPSGVAGALPAEDDPFLADCFADDDCLSRLAATAGQPALLLVVVERAKDQRRARLALVHAGSSVLLRRARDLTAPLERKHSADEPGRGMDDRSDRRSAEQVDALLGFVRGFKH